jgi:anti-sigma factor ChrR (cupin superfamily)
MHPMDGYNIRTPAAAAHDEACRAIRRRWMRGAMMGVSVTEDMASRGRETASFRLRTTQVDTATLEIRCPAVDAARLAFERLWSHEGLNARERALSDRMETK